MRPRLWVLALVHAVGPSGSESWIPASAQAGRPRKFSFHVSSEPRSSAVGSEAVTRVWSRGPWIFGVQSEVKSLREFGVTVLGFLERSRK